MLVRERGVKVTPTLLGTTTVEGGVEVHFEMKSGSTTLRWVSEEEPPQRSLTPLYCLAELLLDASLLLSYFLGKLQKFIAFSQCPQQQFWAPCTTTALIKPYIEKSKDDRQHFSLLLAWVRAEAELHEAEKKPIWEFPWISQASNRKKVLHFCTENDGAEKIKKYSAISTSGLHYWSEDKFCHHATYTYLKMPAYTTDLSRIPLETWEPSHYMTSWSTTLLHPLLLIESDQTQHFGILLTGPNLQMFILLVARLTCPCLCDSLEQGDGKTTVNWVILFCCISSSSPFLSKKGFSRRVCLHPFYLCKSLTYPVLAERINWTVFPEDSPDLWQPLWVHNSNLSVC